MPDVTQLLHEIKAGDPVAADALIPVVYEELRRLAAHRMAGQAPGQTLQATALVHEAWIRLTGNEEALWNDRAHFFRAAAEAMRRILIDAARSKGRQKRDGGQRIDFTSLDLAAETEPEALLVVHEALEERVVWHLISLLLHVFVVHARTVFATPGLSAAPAAPRG